MRIPAPVVVGLVLLCACGEEGLRDRSLMSAVHPDRPVRLTHSDRKRPSTAVIGLDADPLAQYYSEDARLVVRFDELGTLQRKVTPRLREMQRALPALDLPAGPPDSLVRRVLKLSPEVTIDSLRPLAFVRVADGWVGVLPLRDHAAAGARAKALDAIYSVAGDPERVAAYEPSFRKGFYLPGHCSVIAKPDALAALGAALTDATSEIGVDLTVLNGVLAPLPGDIDRVDVALRFGRSAVRVDLRASPDPQSPTALALRSMRPATSAAVRWLPSGGVLYAESLSAPLAWESLLLNMMRDELPRPDPETQADLQALRALLATLGDQTAAVLDLAPDGSGTVKLVTHLKDAGATRAYFVSDGLTRLLGIIAGPGGHLEWSPHVFDASAVPVGSITGHIGRKRLLEWRQSGHPLLACLAVLLRGPVVTYVAVVDDKLALVVGQKARADTEAFVEHLRTGTPVDNDHNVEMAALFPQRLAAFSAELDALFAGCREAAPHWHPRGRALRDVLLPVQVPVAGAVTVEGGALRVALRLRPRQFCEAVAFLGAKLR